MDWFSFEQGIGAAWPAPMAAVDKQCDFTRSHAILPALLAITQIPQNNPPDGWYATLRCQAIDSRANCW
jgi:hypothetical protein